MFSPLADLDRHALERPDSPALTAPGTRLTFGELKVAVDATTIRLRAEGVAPRNLVAVDLPHAQEWIIDLALLRLATRSVSLSGIAQLGDLNADVLITSPTRRSLASRLEVVVDERWFVDARREASGPAPLVPYPRADSIFRLMLTSGTTGTPRAAAYSVDALGHRRVLLDSYWSDGRSELNFMPLSTTGGFHTALANLNHGQAHHGVDRIDAESLRFARYEGIRVLCGSPMQIAAALDVLVANQIPLDTLEEVRMAGASASPTLLRRIASVLGVPVRGVYGSTEGGGVTMRMLAPDDDPANVGAALTGLELQVVDAEGTVVPDGTEGRVRYRSKGQVSGYLDGNVLVPFARGWFEPGDTGTLGQDGTLTLGGRDSEVLNLGGLKVDPARVDAAAADFPGVRDAAAFGFEPPNGLIQLGLAVVGDPDCDLRALDRELRAQLPGAHPTAFWRVAEIPRNRMGKVERGMLAAAFQRQMPQR